MNLSEKPISKKTNKTLWIIFAFSVIPLLVMFIGNLAQLYNAFRFSNPFFVLVLAILCIAFPFVSRFMFKRKTGICFPRRFMPILSSFCLLIGMSFLLANNTQFQQKIAIDRGEILDPKTLGSTASKENTLNSNIDNTSVKTNYITIRNVSLSDMGEGVRELDFETETNLDPEAKASILLFKETIIKDKESPTGQGFKRCTFPVGRQENRLPYSFSELTESNGFTVNEADQVACNTFHYLPKEQKKLFPLIRIVIEPDPEQNSTDYGEVKGEYLMPLKKAIKL